MLSACTSYQWLHELVYIFFLFSENPKQDENITFIPPKGTKVVNPMDPKEVPISREAPISSAINRPKRKTKPPPRLCEPGQIVKKAKVIATDIVNSNDLSSENDQANTRSDVKENVTGTI